MRLFGVVRTYRLGGATLLTSQGGAVDCYRRLDKLEGYGFADLDN
jgi:hypothetical protein